MHHTQASLLLHGALITFDVRYRIVKNQWYYNNYGITYLDDNQCAENQSGNITQISTHQSDQITELQRKRANRMNIKEEQRTLTRE